MGGLSYPLLSDYDKEIAKAYDVLIEPDGIPLRGLFIIDPKVSIYYTFSNCKKKVIYSIMFQGIIRQITINDLPVGRSVDEVIRLVQAFQFVDKHGEGKNYKKNYNFK